MYMTETLLGELVTCDVGAANRVFDPSPMLSDHLPIVAEFRVSL